MKIAELFTSGVHVTIYIWQHIIGTARLQCIRLFYEGAQRPGFICRQWSWIRDIDMTFFYCLSITLWWFGPFPARPLIAGISQLAVWCLLVSSGLIDFASRSIKTPAYPRLVGQECYAHNQGKWWSDWFKTWYVRLLVDSIAFHYFLTHPPTAACIRPWIGSAWFR